MYWSYRDRLCVVTDIEHYSSHPGSHHADAQRRLSQIMKFACRHAGIRWIRARDLQERGDGRMFLLPVGIDETTTIPSLLLGFRHGLYLANREPGPFGRIRMRVSVARGAIAHGDTGLLGQPPITASRIIDADEVKKLLAATPSADLVLVVSDELYRDIIRQEFPGLPSAEFSAMDVQVREFRETAWVHLPERGPALPERDGGPWSAIAAGAVLSAAAVHIGGLLRTESEDWWDGESDDGGHWPEDESDEFGSAEFDGGQGGGADPEDGFGLGSDENDGTDGDGLDSGPGGADESDDPFGTGDGSLMW